MPIEVLGTSDEGRVDRDESEATVQAVAGADQDNNKQQKIRKQIC